jgi:phospholipid-translocating ATPase
LITSGDGGNDVSMIQQADVGVGIEGKEGLQAAMSSDFSILKFKYVKDLMFWHGRKATLSTAYVTLFVIHRGLIIAMIQFYFCMTFYLVAVPFYNAVLISSYTIIYLVLPVIVLVRG